MKIFLIVQWFESYTKVQFFAMFTTEHIVKFIFFFNTPEFNTMFSCLQHKYLCVFIDSASAISGECSRSVPPENIRKPLQGV